MKLNIGPNPGEQRALFSRFSHYQGTGKNNRQMAVHRNEIAELLCQVQRNVAKLLL